MFSNDLMLTFFISMYESCLYVYLFAYSRKQRSGVHLPAEGPRGFASRRAGDAAVWIGQFPAAQQPRDVPEKPHVG